MNVLVIGGGISGASILRELSKYNLKLLLIEKEADLANQASGRNDGQVHPGVDLSKGTLKQSLVKQGNRMYDQIAKELDIPFKRVGQFAGFTQGYLRPVVGLVALERRFICGIDDTRLVGKKFLEEHEPHYNKECKFALYNPMAGVTCPYNVTIAYAENAAENGVEAYLNTAVLSMDTENAEIKAVHTNRGTIYPKIVVNAAGGFSDTVAEMANDRFYSIHPRRGTNSIQDKKAARLINTIASVQLIGKQNFSKAHTKGGGLIRTVHGNVLAGPDAVETFDKEDISTRPESIKTVYDKQKQTIKEVSERDIITYFTGVRAPTFEEDFVIDAVSKSNNAKPVRKNGQRDLFAELEMCE